jgi:hypothetical protein
MNINNTTNDLNHSINRSDNLLCSSTVAKIPIKRPSFFCMFAPVAELVSPSVLRFKLESQLSKQSHLVPPAPMSSYQADNEQVTHWTTSYIADVLFNEMCERSLFVDNPRISSDGEANYYYLQAAKYAERTSAGPNAKQKPTFEIRYKDFTPRLQAELRLLLKDSPSSLDRVVQDAVFRILEDRHKRIFFEHIQSEGLNWRFVSS